jgi:hypothetical protein
MAEAGSTKQPAQQQTIIIKSPLERQPDVFDTPDFDSTKFINQIYPDGGLLLDSGSKMLSHSNLRPSAVGRN